MRCSGQTDNYQHFSFSATFIYRHPEFKLWTGKGHHFSRQWFAPVFGDLLSVYVFLTGRPMGLQPCKPCTSCLQSKEECGLAGDCLCVCKDWEYCSDRCCDICCQMCVAVCSGLCSRDCGYTFCTLCLRLLDSCVSLFTSQQTETSEA